MRIKKWLFISTLLLAASVQAQEISNHAIGLRLGDSDGFGAEVSYQKLLKQSNRLELDLGWRDNRFFNAFKLTGVYQWVKPLEGNFNWYYGAGGGLGSVSFDRITDGNGQSIEPDGGLFIFAAGDVGIEYNFDFPLLLSLDFRPEIGLAGFDNFSDNFNFDIALGVRYQF